MRVTYTDVQQGITYENRFLQYVLICFQTGLKFRLFKKVYVAVVHSLLLEDTMHEAPLIDNL